MTVASKPKKIEFLHLVDNVIDEVGEKIGAVYPFLKDLDPESEEYQLLENMWFDWCHYKNV